MATYTFVNPNVDAYEVYYDMSPVGGGNQLVASIPGFWWIHQPRCSDCRGNWRRYLGARGRWALCHSQWFQLELIQLLEHHCF